MSNRVFFTQANHALSLSGAAVPGARAYFYQNETTTPVAIYADSLFATEQSQPVESLATGVFPEVFVTSSAPIRVLLTDENDVPLAGYPMDNIVPLAASTGGASEIPFAPTDEVPANDVQAAIEAVAALAGVQTDVFQRASTPWTTGGTGNAYTITPTPVVTAYGTWQEFRILANRTNTGAVTLNVNGLGARDVSKINRSGSPIALEAGDIQIGGTYVVVYDGTRMTMVESETYTTTAQTLRLRNGWQFVSMSGLAFAYSNATSLVMTLTYPLAFAGSPAVAITLPHSSAEYTGISDQTALGRVTIHNDSTTGVARQYKAYGAPNFAGTEAIANVRALAVGRWFA